MDDLARKISELKKERGALILAHNYQSPDVQDLADFVGDSLELSVIASKTDASLIVLCGVYFMAETAKMLSPEKTVLIPDLNAKCAMAEMIDAEGLKELQAKHPSAKTVCYVNSTASVKAECDACCTSSNAVRVVAGMDSDEIIFAPDKYLAAHVEKELKKQGISKKIIPWNGFCPTHLRIIPNYLRDLKIKYPSAKIITHPECTPDANSFSDAVLSTSAMVKFVKETSADTIIVGTETGIIHKFKKEAPEKKYIPATDLAICPNMKVITPQKVFEALRDMKYRVEIPPEIAKKASKAIFEMMKFS